MKLYVVRLEGNDVYDGCEDLGIFSSKEKAEKVANDYNSKDLFYEANIYEYELDQVYQD